MWVEITQKLSRFHLIQNIFKIQQRLKESLLDEKLNQAFGKAQEAEKIQEQEKPLL